MTTTHKVSIYSSFINSFIHPLHLALFYSIQLIHPPQSEALDKTRDTAVDFIKNAKTQTTEERIQKIIDINELFKIAIKQSESKVHLAIQSYDIVVSLEL